MTTPNLPILVSNEFPGSELTGDVLEFITAMHAYQRRYRRRYPTWSEALYVLRTLGYAKRVPAARWSESEQELPTEAQGHRENESTTSSPE